MSASLPKLVLRGLVLVLLCLAADFVVGQGEIASERGAKSLKPSNELLIKASVYRDLVGKPSEDAAKIIGAYFLAAEESETPFLQGIFTNWTPRIVVGVTNDVLITATGVTDRLTGKPARLYWAKVIAHTNDTAEATGGWHSSPRAGGEFSYQFKRDGTNWIIESKKRGLAW